MSSHGEERGFRRGLHLREMRYPSRNIFGLMPLKSIPVTMWLCGIIVVVSALAALAQRNWGVGTSDLIYQTGAVLDMQLWRLVTYPLVETSVLGLILHLLMLWIFGGWFESTFGARAYIRFLFLSVVGAGLLAIPLVVLVNMLHLFTDPGIAFGPGAALDAMLVAFAMQAPDSNILFGFVLPMRARTVIYVILGIEVLGGIFTGAAGMSITLGGMLMGYLLVTGNWRPSRLWARMQLWRLRHHRRRGLYVVPPKKRDETLN